MFTYNVRPRVFRISDGAALAFPSDVEVKFEFHPDTAFGNKGAAGRTWRQSTAGGTVFNANTGHFLIKPEQTLDALEVVFEHSNMRLALSGNVLTVATRSESNQELTELIESMYYVFPLVLSLQLRDPVVIDRVSGTVGNIPVAWELAEWRANILITNQDTQERRVVRAWELIDFLSKLGNRRVVTALCYFHTASRLRRAGHSPWEFMGEILLNLSKVLEVLFPPSADGKTREEARNGLTALGYSAEEIEAHFIPVMLLRNEIDAGHVHLGLFTRGELATLHSYTAAMEDKWQEMLDRLLTHLQAGKMTLIPYGVTAARKGAKDIVAQIASNLGDVTAK